MIEAMAPEALQLTAIPRKMGTALFDEPTSLLFLHEGLNPELAVMSPDDWLNPDETFKLCRGA